MTRRCFHRASDAMWSRRIPRVLALVLAAATGACSRLTEVPPPTNIVEPGAVTTPAALAGMYQNAIFKMSQAYAGGVAGSQSFISTSGIFSDELTSFGALDAHEETPQLSNQITTFATLNSVRSGAADAARALAADGGITPSSYIAELHAMQGFVYLMVSELYCSGVPFSSIGNDGRIVYGHAESTADMLNDAIAHFDSALALHTDTARINYLVAVGKGRALLDLGQYDDARTAVAGVPSDFSYQFTYNDAGPYGNFLSSAWAAASNPFGFGLSDFTLSDAEGTNGLPYLTQSDARVSVTVISSPFTGQIFILPNKYPSGTAPIALADGMEARLIEAEAALHDHDAEWLTILNALRTDGTYTVAGTDTTWNPGTGSSHFSPALPGLAPLSDPGSDSARVSLLFRERAYWLYLTGHRQGDMRRLVRQYGRPGALVYPIGITSDPVSPLVRIPDATLVMPSQESDNNPNYSGCINRDA